MSFLLGTALTAADPAGSIARARAAEAAGYDFLTVEAGPLDPLLVAARLAAQTERIGILAVVPTTTTEPFHVSTALATIDVIGGGRAGWLAEVREGSQDEVTWEVPGDLLADAREHVEAVRALWDSWEDGAVIRDAATDRFVDRGRLHHVDLRGEHLAVRGPSITPRPPQGQLPIGARGPLAGADVLFTRDPAATAARRVLELDDAAGIADARARGFTGVLLHGGEAAGSGAVGTLRERFGLGVAANRYAA